MRSIIKTSFAAAFAFFIVTSNAQTLDRSIRPKPAPQPKVQIGKIESFIMDNGLKVFVVENHKLPKVSYSIRLNIDPVTEGDKKGYTDMTAELLGTGTKKRTKDQINSEIDFIGATLSTSSDGIYASCLTKHNTKLLDIVSDVLLNPEFTQEELDKAKNQAVSGLAASKANPEAMAANVSQVLVYGKDHPYGEIMTEATLANVTLEDCQKYYRTYFRPNVAYLAIVGDITLEEAKKLTNEYFGSWQRAEVPRHEIPEPGAPGRTVVGFVPRDGAVQSSIRITYPLEIKPGSSDAIKASVMNNILGGGSSARLFMNLRETYNLTYGAYSQLTPDKYTGVFRAFAEARTIGTDSAVNEFLNEMTRMRSEKVTQAELNGVIQNLTGKFAMSLENPSTIAQFAINIDRYNLPADYYHNYLENLGKVTIDDVFEMAQKYIRPEQAYIVVVGDRNAIPDFIKKWKAKTTVSFYDQYGNDFIEIKKAPEGLTAEKVIENYIAALGGADKLKSVKTEVIKMTGSVMGMNIEIVSKRANPKKKGLSKTALLVKMNGMVVQRVVFNGKEGFMSGMAGSGPLEGEELNSTKAQAEPYSELRYKELGYKLVLTGVEPVDGADAYIVEVTDPSGNKEIQYFDVQTGLLVKTVTITTGEKGEQRSEIILSDYRDINGIKVAHKRLMDMGGQMVEVTVNSVERNISIDKAEFEKEK